MPQLVQSESGNSLRLQHQLQLLLWFWFWFCFWLWPEPEAGLGYRGTYKYSNLHMFSRRRNRCDVVCSGDFRVEQGQANLEGRHEEHSYAPCAPQVEGNLKGKQKHKIRNCPTNNMSSGNCAPHSYRLSLLLQLLLLIRLHLTF